jgi:hypothetical protein
LAFGLWRAFREPWPVAARFAATLGAFTLLACVLAGLRHGAAAIHGWGLHPVGACLFALAYLGVTIKDLILGPPNSFAALPTPSADWMARPSAA